MNLEIGCCWIDDLEIGCCEVQHPCLFITLNDMCSRSLLSSLVGATFDPPPIISIPKTDDNEK